MFSILIPTWNNLAFVQCCVASIQKNSSQSHQIILHINDGTDGTLDWAIQNGIDYSYSAENIGICKAVNASVAKANHHLIMYMNDDMYCLPNWDEPLLEAINTIDADFFMFSATMIEPTHTNNPCVVVQNFGNTPANFQEQALKSAASTFTKSDWNGAFWPPNVVPLSLWQAVGGFSEEFSPGMSSDDDFVAKCWHAGCRVFRGIGNSLVYHFQGKSTQRIIKNNGRKQFLQKWGITQSSFRKYYLQLGTLHTQSLSAPNATTRLALRIKGKIKLLFTK
jgi:glycosyltransferase involved in cell wall biosynthesis